MNGRTILFIFASSAIMLVAMTLQNAYGPKPTVAPQPTESSNTVASLDADTAEQQAPLDSESPSNPDTPDTHPSENAEDNTAAEGQPQQDATVGEDSAPSEESEDNAEDEAEIASGPGEFYTIGSLSEDGSDRFLITVNPMGGTIRRVELNYRHEQTKRIAYRDLEYDGGYLGNIEPQKTADGLKVRVVGAGTPAATATSESKDESGIRTNDILMSLAGEPITSSEDLNEMLASTKPGDSVQIVVKRDGKTITQTVTLTEKPIELIRPENTRVSEGFDLPESFVLALVKTRPELDKPWPDLDLDMRSKAWELDSARTNASQIALTRTISNAQLAKFELAGPIVVSKIYSLPDLPAEQIYDLDSKTFHLNLTVEIRNESDVAQKLAYELDGPAGATTEAWWYTMKIHGRSSAIGYVAGARDVVGGNQDDSFVFFGGPEIVDGAADDPPVVNFICDPYQESPEARQLLFAGVDTQYFNISLIPTATEEQPFEVNSVSAFINGSVVLPDNVRLQKLVDCTFQMVKSIEIPPGQTYSHTFEVFAGPKEQSLLYEYGLGEVETFGWFAWFSKPLLWLLHFFYFITFKFSYGIAIIMLTVLVRCFMIPFSRKAAINGQMMQHLQPQMMAIKEKYPEDMQKQSQAQRELFSKYNYNPLSGCLPMFIQLPIFIGLYRGLSVDIALRDKPLIPGLSWCSDLSAPDQLFYWKDWMPTMLGDETGWLGPFFNILPIATMVLFMFQQKLFMPKAVDDQQKMMQSMMSIMMPIMGLMFFKVPAGLCLYIITSSLWGIVERLMLPKPVLDTSKFDDLGDGGSSTLAKSTQPGDGGSDFASLQNKAQAERQERKRADAERQKRLRDRK